VESSLGAISVECIGASPAGGQTEALKLSGQGVNLALAADKKQYKLVEAEGI
jgi:hypothetical protein